MQSNLYFETAEYQRRLQRARERMREQGIDAMLVSDSNNLTYFTGYRTNLFDSKFRPFFALLPVEGEPFLILPSLEKGVGEETSWISDIKSWGTRPGDLGRDPLDTLIQVLSDAGLGSATIAIELSNQRIGMSVKDFELRVKAGLPDVTWADLCPIAWELRAVKSSAELDKLRRANEITDAGYHAVLDEARVGTTEKEIQATMGRTFLAEGGDLKGFIVVASGPGRYKMANPFASARALEDGDMCVLDFGAVYDGYWSDLTRGFFAGSISPRQRELYEVSVEATARTIAHIRPGMTCEEVDLFAESQIVDAGYKDLLMHRTGHSIGLEVHELPSLGVGDQTVLVPGMVVAVEPAMYDFSVGCFRMEDIVTITETGAEYLSHANRDIVVV